MIGNPWGTQPLPGRSPRGGNPPQRPDQAAQLSVTRAGTGPAPQSNVVTARLVYIIGATGGLFVYSPTAGAGNLVASISADGGTDPYGNIYLPGTTSYLFALGRYTASSLNGGAVQFYSAATFGPWGSPIALISATSSALDLVTAGLPIFLESATYVGAYGTQLVVADLFGATAITSAQLEVQGSAVAKAGIFAQAATPSGSPPAGAETWNSLGALAGFSVAEGRYKLTAENEVVLDIEVTAGGANAASVSFANSLPASYSPLVARQFPLSSTRAVTAADPWPRLSVGATGVVSVLSAANTTASLGTNVRIPLD
jgi:hypothetical protein